VCDGDSGDEIGVMDLLASLTHKSLIVADTTGELERYHLLESTRAYALEKLIAVVEHEQMARRHAEYFCDRALAADACYGTGSTLVWIANAELEIDNYRAALDWAFTGGRDPALGGAIAGALGRLWSSGGLGVEGRFWVGKAQAMLGVGHPEVAARLWLALSALNTGKRKVEYAERSMDLFQSVGDEFRYAWASCSLAYGLFQMGRLEDADAANARALAVCSRLGSEAVAASMLSQQATVKHYRGDVNAARESFAQALTIYKSLGDEGGIAHVLGNLAELEFKDGHAEEALRLACDGLEILPRARNARLFAIAYSNIAAYRLALGDLVGAGEAAREGLHRSHRLHDPLQIPITLQHLALLAALRGDARRASLLGGYVDAQFVVLGNDREYTEMWGYDKLITTLHAHMSDAEISKLAAEGAAWSEDQAIDEAHKI
jgi:tetratricopeptide (TPR) repeat protein